MVFSGSMLHDEKEPLAISLALRRKNRISPFRCSLRALTVGCKADHSTVMSEAWSSHVDPEQGFHSLL